MKSYNEMAENVLKRRDQYVTMRRKQSKKLSAVISCICLCAAIGIGAWQSGLFEKQPAQTADDAVVPGIKDWYGPGEDSGELAPDISYVYVICEGRFSEYVGGKVIAEDKIGGKITDVTLTAGWKQEADAAWLSQETLRGEVYSIEGVENDVAVALLFIDRGEALTTTHYYVIMNPNADLSAVEEYVITQADKGCNGNTVAE